MTLTVCIGSSGSGKTTFLNDVHSRHKKCIYIRQYHVLRPYIKVSKIPNFNSSNLPYWPIYVKEGKDQTIKVGGTMSGTFTAGLSGGQRKLLLFELIYQRTLKQSNLLIVLDEPFAGVTDDFVPFIVEQLNAMRQKHNLLLVTNDHVQALTEMADSTIRVSASDRRTVTVNEQKQVEREKAILALSQGEDLAYKTDRADLRFFFDVEIASNQGLIGVGMFTALLFGLFLVAFWDSSAETVPLLVIASTQLVFFCTQPYNTTLVDYRNAMLEEAEARVHASKAMNRTLKTALAIGLVFLVSLIEYGCVNAVVEGLEAFKFWLAMFCDVFSLSFPLIAVSLYTSMPLQATQFVGSLPFLMVIFFSTTFSPGSGVAIVEQLRYLFPRFYFWCMLPSDVSSLMEGCPPAEQNVLYLVLSSLVYVFIFFVFRGIGALRQRSNGKVTKAADTEAKQDEEFKVLQDDLFGNATRCPSQQSPTDEGERDEDGVRSFPPV